VTTTPVALALHRLRPGPREDLHARAPEHALENLGGVGVLPRQHQVAAADEDDVRAERVVGARELRAGDAGADDDEPFGAAAPGGTAASR
jgi:hypothetical protein